jgi:hypothetical protein
MNKVKYFLLFSRWTRWISTEGTRKCEIYSCLTLTISGNCTYLTERIYIHSCRKFQKTCQTGIAVAGGSDLCVCGRGESERQSVREGEREGEIFFRWNGCVLIRVLRWVTYHRQIPLMPLMSNISGQCDLHFFFTNFHNSTHISRHISYQLLIC